MKLQTENDMRESKNVETKNNGSNEWGGGDMNNINIFKSIFF
jgi:hypothetical protein